MAENVTPLLSKIPLPENGTDEAFARGVIEMVLNATLNRYLAELEDAGYKRPRKFVSGAGWDNGKPNQLLQLKFDIIDEAINTFSPEIIIELRKRKIF